MRTAPPRRRQFGGTIRPASCSFAPETIAEQLVHWRGIGAVACSGAVDRDLRSEEIPGRTRMAPQQDRSLDRRRLRIAKALDALAVRPMRHIVDASLILRVEAAAHLARPPTPRLIGQNSARNGQCKNAETPARTIFPQLAAYKCGAQPRPSTNSSTFQKASFKSSTRPPRPTPTIATISKRTGDSSA
jgi:hypothetical protein